MVRTAGQEIPGSRLERAAALGELVKTKIERGDRYSAPEIYNLEITLLEVVQGSDARTRVQEEGILPPPAGWEYVLARLSFGYFSKGRGLERLEQSFVIGQDFFAAVSADGNTEYPPPPLLQQPQPSLIDKPFQPGDRREGWILLQVPETEKHLFLIFKREFKEFTYGVWGPVWFRLASL